MSESELKEQIQGICYKLAVSAYNSDQPRLVDSANEVAQELLDLTLNYGREQRIDELAETLKFCYNTKMPRHFWSTFAERQRILKEKGEIGE